MYTTMPNLFRRNRRKPAESQVTRPEERRIDRRGFYHLHPAHLLMLR